jgi:hypothetical protein
VALARSFSENSHFTLKNCHAAGLNMDCIRDDEQRIVYKIFTTPVNSAKASSH